MTRRVEVLVAGAGISGLTVAYDLTRAGIDCLVAERAERPGGLISTRSVDGYVMDPGPDAFLTQKPQAMALCGELGLTPEIIPTNPDRQKVFVLRDGRLHALPAGMRLTVPTRVLPLLGSELFTLGGKLRLLAEWLVPRRKDPTEESIAEFVTRRFGAEALERVGEPLLAGIHCGDARKLSMNVLFPRLVDLERRYGSVSRGMIRAGGPGGETAFSSLAPGMKRLIDALRDRLPEERVLLGREVVSASRDGDDYVCELASGETVRSRALVVALPIRAAESLTRGSFPEIAEPLSRIETVSSAVVFHAFEAGDVSHPLDGYGFVVPDGEPNRLLAATFVTTKFPDRAPEGKLLFRTFLGGLRDPEALELDDEALAELSRRELARVLGPMGEPLFSRVVRWTKRTPQVELGHRGHLDALEAACERNPGTFVIGNGLWSIGIPDCIGVARDTAKRLRSYLRAETVSV